jgi:hypothetical protein
MAAVMHGTRVAQNDNRQAAQKDGDASDSERIKSASSLTLATSRVSARFRV